jgi:hypothetical protein
VNRATRHDLGKAWDVTNHVCVTNLETGLLGKLVPDVKPLAILAVDTLSANFNLNVINEGVANPVKPTELVTGAVKLHTGKCHLKVDTVDQITVARNCAGDLFSEVSRTVEGLLDRLHREVSVTTVHNLKEGNLGITGKVDVLSAISYKLH